MKNFLIISALVLTSGVAAAQNWAFDKAHSSVLFSVDHMVVSEAQGKFTDFAAEITGSKDDFSDVKVKATIKVASINTDNGGRDNHLKSADFFDAEKYPDIVFESTSFTKTSGNQYDIAGKLTMHGVTKDVVLKGKIKGPINAGKNREGKDQVVAGITASLVINRQDYGVSWKRLLTGGELAVGEEVRITVNAEFKK
jgi:polyisoprenoid-binding protein YceI